MSILLSCDCTVTTVLMHAEKGCWQTSVKHLPTLSLNLIYRTEQLCFVEQNPSTPSWPASLAECKTLIFLLTHLLRKKYKQPNFAMKYCNYANQKFLTLCTLKNDGKAITLTVLGLRQRHCWLKHFSGSRKSPFTVSEHWDKSLALQMQQANRVSTLFNNRDPTAVRSNTRLSFLPSLLPMCANQVNKKKYI